MTNAQITIFMSHAQPDSAFVERLKADVGQQGFSNWRDRQAVPAGQRGQILFNFVGYLIEGRGAL